MTKTAKTITYAAGIFTAFWLIIAFLITSVEAVTYWTPGYYEKEYTKYQVLNDLPEMTMDDLLDVNFVAQRFWLVSCEVVFWAP